MSGQVMDAQGLLQGGAPDHGEPDEKDDDERFRDPPSQDERFRDPPSQDERFRDPPSQDERFRDPPSQDERYRDPPSQDSVRSAASTPSNKSDVITAAREAEKYAAIVHKDKPPLGSPLSGQPIVTQWMTDPRGGFPTPVMSPAAMNPPYGYNNGVVYSQGTESSPHQSPPNPNMPSFTPQDQHPSFSQAHNMSFNQILNPNFSQGNNLSFFQRLSQGYNPGMALGQSNIPQFVEGPNRFPSEGPASSPQGSHPYKCTDKYCGKTFDNEKTLLDHLHICRATEEALGLFRHGAKFCEKSAFQLKPEKTVDGFPYTCASRDCAEHFVSKTALQHHTKIRHSQKLYCCQIRACNMAFTNDAELKMHLKDAHELPYPCPERDCGKAFKHKKFCMKHVMNIHHGGVSLDGSLLVPPPGLAELETIHRCPHEGCGKTFKNKYILATHQTTHSDERLFQCQVEGCWKTYRTKGALKQHGAKQHGITDNMKAFLATQRPFKCPEAACAVAFDTKGKLKMHLDDHAKVRPYRCPEPMCGKAFKCKAGLGSHSVCHREERPFPCTVEDCKKSFKTRVVRDQHEKTHFK